MTVKTSKTDSHRGEKGNTFSLSLSFFSTWHVNIRRIIGKSFKDNIILNIFLDNLVIRQIGLFYV